MKTRRTKAKRQRRQKRGIVLIIVISLLALFILLGITFALVASGALSAAKIDREVNRVGDQPETEMDLAVGQIIGESLVRFSPLYRSSLQGQSLLADMYGVDGLTAFVAGTPTTNNPLPNTNTNPPTQRGQILVFEAVLAPQAEQPFQQPTQWRQIPDYYVGRVLTFVTGQLAGKSTRIVHFAPGSANANPTIYVEMPKHDSTTGILPSAATPDKFVINGAPFNGTGYGYRPAPDNDLDATAGTGAALTPPINNDYRALLPHFAGYAASNAYASAALPGGMDESYDAADYQNMFLAMVPALKALDTSNSVPLMPSYHRPDLVNYWANRLSNGGQPPTLAGNSAAAFNNRNFLRQVIFRPMPWDHPNFTGSNPSLSAPNQTQNEYATILGYLTSLNIPYWDVDNDGDGVMDSIWIDAGLPVVTSPDGRRYKRLFAIMIQDLDNRINVNVHGNSQQWANSIANDQHRTGYQITAQVAGQNPAAPTPIYLSRGLGYGPAEVDFEHIFGNTAGSELKASDATASTIYQGLITARYSRGNETAPGYLGEELNSRIRQLGVPFTDHRTEISAFASPPDVWGRAVVALDYYGQPIYSFQGAAANGPLGVGETIDDPYEVQFDHTRAPADNPFLPTELERLLRFHDVDAQQIPSRLLAGAQGLLGVPTTNLTVAAEPPGFIGLSHLRRNLLTTHSFDVPVLAAVLAKEMRGTNANVGSNSILDLYNAQLSAATPYQDHFNAIVPFELRHGELFNINRPFGDGADSNNPANFVGDDPSEFSVAEYIAGTTGVVPPSGITVEKANDMNTLPATFSNRDRFDPRQIFARQLYCLMKLLVNTTFNVPVNVDGNMTTGDANDTSRFLAQWAVNVVDFRDSDSINTYFDYDPNPFDADGWVPSQRVWGVERPEILLSETIAWHDRATEDLANEQPDPATDPAAQVGPDPMMDDTDYDQRLKPRGAFFAELFNPWYDVSQNMPGQSYVHRPLEIYAGAYNPAGGVRLNGRVNNDSPIWRMLVVRNAPGAMASNSHTNISNGANPDLPRPESLPANDIERSIYFTDPTTMVGRAATQGLTLNHGTAYWSNLAIAPLLPGRYAVVGGYDEVNGNDYITYVGRADNAGTGAVDDGYRTSNNTRRIVLAPNINPDFGTPQVQVLDNTNVAGQNEINTAQVQFPIAAVINQGGAGSAYSRKLTITEPVNGYTLPGNIGFVQPASSGTNLDGEYEEIDPATGMTLGTQRPIDVPLDRSRMDGNGNEWEFLNLETTRGNVRTLLLQRLANPLELWHPINNPYITIDRSSVDVTAFNGVVNDQQDPFRQGKNETVNFQSFERGGSSPTATWSWNTVVAAPQPANPDTERRFWTMTPPRTPGVDPPTTSPLYTGAVTQHFPFRMIHTLATLNTQYGARISKAQSFPYGGAPAPGGTTNMAFPWLTHLNRPFTSPLELLQVPATNQYDLLNHFSLRDATASEYGNNSFGAPYAYTDTNTNQIGYRLLNFFQAQVNASSTGAQLGPQFNRLFDYIGVPSPYANADLYYNAAHFNSTAAPVLPGPQPAMTYRPPFNKLSRFRDPGRVNINTVYDDPGSAYGAPVLSALFKGNLHMDPNAASIGGSIAFANDLLVSRRGYTAPSIYAPNASFPSIFSNPYRAQDAGDLVPSIGGLQKRTIDSGFLRSQTLDGALSSTSLIAYDQPTTAVPTQYDNTNRNPYFRYQRYQKLGNLLTTRSNVFAVWITVGYFEVDPVIPDAAHPDGYTLGQEVGLDSGNVVRHRAFYIIDRSIPVGFLPGSRLNTDECILVKRMIE